MKLKMLSIILIILLLGCTGTKNTTSYIEVIEKTKSDGKYYLTVINPYDKKTENLKLQTDRNVWNLVQEGSIYFATYENDSYITVIEIPDNPKNN